MAIHAKPARLHWNYFLALESDVARVARFVEFQPANFSTFSIELGRILLSASSEIDVVAELVCSQLDPNAKPQNINAYAKIILTSTPKFVTLAALIPRFGLTLRPWDSWTEKDSPLWWRAYNGVKHQRATFFHEANLDHALNAVAALFLITVFYYANQDGYSFFSPDADSKRCAITSRLTPQSALFRLRSALGDFAEEHDLNE